MSKQGSGRLSSTMPWRLFRTLPCLLLLSLLFLLLSTLPTTEASRSKLFDRRRRMTTDETTTGTTTTTTPETTATTKTKAPPTFTPDVSSPVENKSVETTETTAEEISEEVEEVKEVIMKDTAGAADAEAEKPDEAAAKMEKEGTAATVSSNLTTTTSPTSISTISSSATPVKKDSSADSTSSTGGTSSTSSTTPPSPFPTATTIPKKDTIDTPPFPSLPAAPVNAASSEGVIRPASPNPPPPVVLFQKLVTVIAPDTDSRKEGTNGPLPDAFKTTTTTTSAAAGNNTLPTLLEAAAAEVLNVEEAFKQCLGARLGTDAVADIDMTTLLPGARRRLQELASEDASCAVRRPFMLVINQTQGLEALGGLISQPLLDHNITSFRAMGAGTTGCFVVPLDRCAAEELLLDPRIAVAVPVESSMKRPLHFQEGLTSTIAAIETAAAAGEAAAGNAVSKATSAVVDGGGGVGNISSLNDLPTFAWPGTGSDFSYIPDVKDVINDAMLGGQGGQEEREGVQERGIKTISLHVTLVDTEDMEIKVEQWREEMKQAGLDIANVTFTITDEVPLLEVEGEEGLADASLNAASTATEDTFATLAETGEKDLAESESAVSSGQFPLMRTKYLVLNHVPPSVAAALSDFLIARPVVDFVELTPKLLFLTRWARGVTQSGNWQETPISSTFDLDGNGQIIGMADTGIDPSVCYVEDRNSRTPYNSVSSTHRKLVTYITFADRQENTEKQGTAHSIGHGTHVASTLVGRSIASTGSALYNGIAPNSKVAFFDIAKYDGAGNIQLYPPGNLNTDLFERLYKAGARVMSMSWGSPDSNCYSSYAVMVDEFMHNYPDALVIFAAGNSGIQGDYSVVTPSTAKSCVTVGASYNVQQTSFGLENNVNYVAYFSSFGPTADGRLKPDLVAPGYYITSAKALTSCDTIQSRGTSMATPVVAGNAALIRQWFMKGLYQNRAFVPSGALLKAMLVHSSQRMAAYEDANGALRAMAYPDNHQGYGRMQLDQVVDTKGLYTLLAYGTQDPRDPRFRRFSKQGDTHEYKLRVSNSTRNGPRALKVTLVWTDRPGSATSCQKTRQSVLTNDLDLTITEPRGKVVYPMATGGAGPDRFNPLEQIIISSPEAGGNYTISVRAFNLVTPQDYALVISGQFSGFAYNETAGAFGPTNSVWASFVNLLNGSTGGAIMMVLFLCLIGVASISLCVRPPARQRLLDSIESMARRGGQGGLMQGGLNAARGAGTGRREGVGERHVDAEGPSLAYVAPPEKPAPRPGDANRVELHGGLA